MSTSTAISVPTGAGRLRLGRAGSFRVVALSYLALMIAGSAPSPIYPIYQREWGFATSTLTEIFAVYAVLLLLALLTVGGLSDLIGRRPVLLAGLGLFTVDMVVFALAPDVQWLFVARVLQGIAAGLSIGAMTAGLIDLAPPGKVRFASVLSALIPAIGLAAGALISGALVRFGPMPTRLVYLVLGAGFLVLAVLVALMPASGDRRPVPLSALTPRMRIPAQARRTFLQVLPALVVPWAQLGFTLSLTSSVALGVFGVHDVFVDCLLVALPCAAGALSGFLTRSTDGQRANQFGMVGMSVGSVITVVGLVIPLVPVYLVGSLIAGLGVGAAISGTFKVLAPLPAEHERAEFFAAFFVAGYLAFSLPAVAAGFAIGSFGLVRTAVVYSAVLVVLALVAMLTGRRRVTREG
ncbi:MFS transporter [Nakamurella alba]|nr:MFS transporter [Nakamurella alba]